MSNTDTETATAAKIIEKLARETTAKTLNIVSPDKIRTEILILPDGQGGIKTQSLKPHFDEYRQHPERRKGTATMTDLDSLIAHVNRFKNPNSALFADDSENPALTAVIDYHDQCNSYDESSKPEPVKHDPQPRFGQHRTHYKFPLSEEWQAWSNINGEALDQNDFAFFLEDRIIDVAPPPDFLTVGKAPASEGDKRLTDLVERIGGRVCGHARLMELSRGLRVSDKQSVANIVNTSTGEGQIHFESEHTSSDGKKLKIPNLFLIAIPVFRNGPAYRLPVRLRYRLGNGKIIWTLSLHRPDIARDHAFSEACEKARKETALPLFYGAPEFCCEKQDTKSR